MYSVSINYRVTLYTYLIDTTLNTATYVIVVVCIFNETFEICITTTAVKLHFYDHDHRTPASGKKALFR